MLSPFPEDDASVGSWQCTFREDMQLRSRRVAQLPWVTPAIFVSLTRLHCWAVNVQERQTYGRLPAPCNCPPVSRVESRSQDV